MTYRRASTQLLAVSRLIENLAAIYPDAIERLWNQADAIDGYPRGGEGINVTSTSELTPTEAAASAREGYTNHRLDIEAGVRLLAVTAHDILDACHRALRGDVRVEGPRLCDPSGKEGALVPIDDGGWADWTCRESATKAGLCAKHYMACRRYRQRLGLRPLEEDAA